MTAGVFEPSLTSDAEVARQRRQAADRLAAAVYEVRERFGPWLFAAPRLPHGPHFAVGQQAKALMTIASVAPTWALRGINRRATGH